MQRKRNLKKNMTTQLVSLKAKHISLQNKFLVLIPVTSVSVSGETSFACNKHALPPYLVATRLQSKDSVVQDTSVVSILYISFQHQVTLISQKTNLWLFSLQPSNQPPPTQRLLVQLERLEDVTWMENFTKLERRLNLPVVLALNANVITVVLFNVIPKIAHLKHLFFWEWIETFSRQSRREDNKVLVFPSSSSFYKESLSRITGKNESSGGQINSSGNEIKWQSLFPQFIPSWYLCHPYIIFIQYHIFFSLIISSFASVSPFHSFCQTRNRCQKERRAVSFKTSRGW